jgi:hypothetical protein
LIRFFIVLLTAGGILYGGGILTSQYAVIPLPSYFVQTLLFLVFSTGLLFAYLYRSASPGYFVQLYLLSMAIKLLAYGAYNLVIIRSDPSGAIPNVVFFMLAYFIFTVLEIVFLYRKISGS